MVHVAKIMREKKAWLMFICVEREGRDMSELVCSVCGEALTERNHSCLFDRYMTEHHYRFDKDVMKKMGVEKMPVRGWVWDRNPRTGERYRMYRVCGKCFGKADEILGFTDIIPDSN